MPDTITIAQQFGASLDKDQFEQTKRLLSESCTYIIGERILRGPDSICESYEQNMLEGRRKLDELEWGESSVEQISNNQFIVHFIDYLRHQGVQHIHKCEQRLTINEDQLITEIQHIDNAIEQQKLDAFYRQVGLKD